MRCKVVLYYTITYLIMHGTGGYFYNQKLLADAVSMATDIRIEPINLSVSQTLLVPFSWCTVSPELCSCVWVIYDCCSVLSFGSRLSSKISVFKVWSVSHCLWPAGVKKAWGLKLIHMQALLLVNHLWTEPSDHRVICSTAY